MNKEKKIILILVAIAVLSAVIYFIYQWWQKEKAKKATSAPDTSSATSSNTVNTSSGSIWGNDNFPLKKNSAGERVKRLQEGINRGYKALGESKTISTDGLYGAVTETAVNYFKGKLSLTQDGQVTEGQYNQYILPLYNASKTTSQDGWSLIDILSNPVTYFTGS